MKTVLFLLGCFFILLAQGTGKYQNDLADAKLKGSVKSCVELFYEKNLTTPLDKEAWSFKSKNVFNKQGNIIEDQIYSPRFRDSIIHQIIYTFDDEERKIMTATKAGRAVSKSEYSYNSRHNLVEVISFIPKLSTRIIYNNQGYRDTMYLNDIVGRLQSIFVYNYDKKNNLIRLDEQNADGSITRNTFYKHDSHNNKIEELVIWKNGVKVKSSFKYDERDNPVMLTDSNTNYIGGFDNSFNKEPGVYIHTYSYENFDKAGNWLQKNELFNNKIERVIKREIEYY